MTTIHGTGSPTQNIDALIARLVSGERTWSRTSLAERRDLLLEVCAATSAHAEEWVRIACEIKQLDAASPLVGEEWITGPYALIGYLQALPDTLQRLAAGSDVLAGYHVDSAPGERLAVHVLPHDAFDTLLLNGFHAEIWTTPGITGRELRAKAGLGQRTPEHTNGVSVVLGAGNIFSIAPLDLLHQLYAENRTAVLKLNPTTDPLADVFRAIFKPMIDRNLVEIVTGGPELGAALSNHPRVAAVHMTGSAATHDALVWGTGDAAEANKAADAPLLTKPITSELGGVAPVIVVPGRWSAADIRFQAQHVATQRLHNDGHNCIAAQVVIVSSDWPQKDEFLTALREALREAPARPAWYPGTTDRVATARETYGSAAIAIGGTPERTLVHGLDLSHAAEPAFTTEYFAPVLGVAELSGTGLDFLTAAIDKANERLYGTLGANIVIDPRTAKSLGPDLDRSIAELRYGTIGINAWTGVGYLTPRASWGAFPGHALADIQSGRGVVHNALLLDHVERTVVRGPFRPAPRTLLSGGRTLTPKPPWFVNNRTAATTGRRLTAFAARPRWRALPAIFASALRG